MQPAQLDVFVSHGSGFRVLEHHAVHIGQRLRQGDGDQPRTAAKVEHALQMMKLGQAFQQCAGHLRGDRALFLSDLQARGVGPGAAHGRGRGGGGGHAVAQVVAQLAAGLAHDPVAKLQGIAAVRAGGTVQVAVGHRQVAVVRRLLGITLQQRQAPQQFED